MREPTLSLCMIVRNEEAFLEECLASARPIVDELIIVDTGSTDQTPAIARKYGANVIFHPWNDDFSEARNVGLDRATGDWILMLDADECLAPEGHAEIREAIRNERIAAYQLPVVNVYDNGQSVISLITRLFRNDPSIRFENVIHEQVTKCLTHFARERSLDFASLKAQIIHRGYHPTVVEARRKDHRNLRLFRKQIERHPDDIYSRFKYADFLRRYPDPTPAQEAFKTAYEMLYSRPRGPRADLLFAGEIIAFHALYSYYAGDIREADDICRKGIDDLPSATPNLLHVAGRIALAVGDAHRAEELFRRCIAMAGHALAIPGQPGITSYLSMAELGKVLHSTGRRDEAWQWFDQAVHEAGGESSEPILALSQCLVAEGRPAEALKCLAGYIRSWRETPELILMTGRVLLEIGNPAAAEKWFKRSIESQETEKQGRALLARARLFQGELQLALNDWSGLPDAEKSHANRFIGIIRGDRVDRPVDFDNPLERYVIGSFLRGLRAQGHTQLIQSFHDNQSRLDPRTPELERLYQPTPMPSEMHSATSFNKNRVDILPETAKIVGGDSDPLAAATVEPSPMFKPGAATPMTSAPRASTTPPAPSASDLRAAAPTSPATSAPASAPGYAPRASVAPSAKDPSETLRPSKEIPGDAVAMPEEDDLEQRVIAIDRPYASVFAEGGKVLDIGCDHGRFLEILQASGRTGVGVDADAHAIAACRDKGLTVEERAWTDIDDLPQDFDGVHAARVIETMTGREARTFLESCVSRLRPGGALVIRTRNWDNERVREGSFWLDLETVRPYPLALLADLLAGMDLTVELRGHETAGWNDTYVVARKACLAGTEQPARDHRPTGLPRVIWEGEFFAPQSYALINREISSRWVRNQQCEVTLLPADTVSADDADRHAALVDRVHAPLTDQAEFHIRHRWPALFHPPAEGRWIQIQPYEFGRIPKSWIAPILDSVDEIWVPSHYARRCYTSSGIPEDRVAVVPNGVDCDRFHPDAEPLDLPTDKRFRFLFVGGSIWRKGIDVLLDVYRRTFRKSDDVCLIIKDTCLDSFYKDRNFAERIREFAADPVAPEIVYLDEPISEEDMPRLFTACDALVHPYRGEGFGLPVIEAMACGKPVIVTRGGACDEFLPAGASFDVAARRLAIQPAGLVLAGDGWVLEPGPESLAQAMRSAVEQNLELQSMGEIARDHVAKNFSWTHAAELARRRLEALRSRPPRRFQPTAGVEKPIGPFEKAVQCLLLADPDAAMEVLVSESAFRPDDPLISYWMGMAFQQKGDLARARDCFEQALRIDQNLPDAWYNLGLVEANSGHPREALAAMEKARELGMENAALFNDLGVIYSESGDMTEAERSVRRALELAPNDTDAVYNLGMLWLRQGRNADALSMAESVLVSSPDHAGARSLIEQVRASRPDGSQTGISQAVPGSASPGG